MKIERRTSLASVMTVLAILTLPLSACVSSGKYKMAVQERDELADANQNLESDVEKKSRERDELAEQRAQLEKDRALLESAVREMEMEKAELDAALTQQSEEMDRLKSTYSGLVTELKEELAAGEIEITQMRDGINVNVAQDILFPSGSAELDKDGREVLIRVAGQLKDVPYQIIVSGHTDNVAIGPNLAKRFPTNWELAGARSARVVRLFEESEIDGVRLLAVSRGETMPVASNDTPEGQKKNRRIEIRLRPVVQEG